MLRLYLVVLLRTKKIQLPMLDISEHFFSIQGEGITAGTPSYFIRLKGCNLLCGNPTANIKTSTQTEIEASIKGATWCCDTISVWVKGEKYSSGQLLEQIKNKGYHEWLFITNKAHLIFTGGEPTLKKHRKGIMDFYDYCMNYYKHIEFNPYVEIETNATKVVEDVFYDKYITQINASPKLSNSGMPKNKRINPDALRQINSYNNSWFKFVVSSEEDIKEIKRDYLKYISENKIILMPAIVNQDKYHERQLFVYELAKKEGFKAINRNHISAWNKKTGV